MQLGSGNGTSFPTSVDTATTEVNSPASGKTKARAEVANDLLSAVVAIETSLKDGTIDSWTTKYPSVQRVVTGSRTIGTAYQNTTGRPMFVAVSATSTVVSLVSGNTDANNPPTTVVDRQDVQVGGYYSAVRFWVLAGNYYKVVVGSGTPTLGVWTEWY